MILAVVRRKTDEQFKQEIYNLVGDEYTFLDPYVTAKTKISIKHNKCGNIYKVKPNKFLTGRRCPYCAGLIKKTDEQFKQEVYNLVGDEYSFLDPYANARTKIRVKHNKCGNVYLVTPDKFLYGRRCPYCSGKLKRTDEKFKQEVYDLVDDEYTFLDSYVNVTTKIRVKHNKCGNVYEVRPNDFINNNSRCPYCNGKHKRTDEEFKQEVYELVGDEYNFMEEYQGVDTKIIVKHNKCGNTYKVIPNNFFKGSRCPYCDSPKGEVIISKILDNLNINYEAQKTFDDLKDKSYLSYDFYIPDQNILLEYQGIQHYEPIDYFGGEYTFKTQQKHDQIKSDYAKNNGYSLIAVPYTEDTLFKIKKYLTKHGLNYKEKLWEY